MINNYVLELSKGEINIQKDKQKLNIIFNNNLDLYFIYSNSRSIVREKETFMVDKTDSIYDAFNGLYDDIINSRITTISKLELDLLYDSEEEKKKVLEKLDDKNKEYKKLDSYKKLVTNDTICYISDEDEKNINCHKLIIEKLKDNSIKLTFMLNPKYPYGDNFAIPIRFRNSNSEYKPYNICFMRFYKELLECVKMNKKEEYKLTK